MGIGLPAMMNAATIPSTDPPQKPGRVLNASEKMRKAGSAFTTVPKPYKAATVKAEP